MSSKQVAWGLRIEERFGLETKKSAVISILMALKAIGADVPANSECKQRKDQRTELCCLLSDLDKSGFGANLD